jgi:hypothetical protein
MDEERGRAASGQGHAADPPCVRGRPRARVLLAQGARQSEQITATLRPWEPVRPRCEVAAANHAVQNEAPIEVCQAISGRRAIALS